MILETGAMENDHENRGYGIPPIVERLIYIESSGLLAPLRSGEFGEKGRAFFCQSSCVT